MNFISVAVILVVSFTFVAYFSFVVFQGVGLLLLSPTRQVSYNIFLYQIPLKYLHFKSEICLRIIIIILLLS
jgi:hypothetical protein